MSPLTEIDPEKINKSRTLTGIFTPPESATASCGCSAPHWNEDVIPPEHPARTLILCFDGTGDQFDADNSNVVQFVSTLKKDDRRQQMVYYQAGIGTYTKHQTTFGHKLSKIMDLAVAWDLSSHTKSGYQFLMENYQCGDKICIFGFSRGAYTARSLAGMLTKVGLLPPGNHEQIDFAYKMYVREDYFGWEQSALFKQAFSVNVQIDFLGVWDTVNSVGIVHHRLPFTISNSSIRYFRHAVSLDERRAKFKANLWPPGNVESPITEMIETEKKKRGKKQQREPGLKQLEKMFSDTTNKTDILEVWFSGCHCDVGGGAVLNGTPHSLSRITLRWMIRQCFAANTGIMFHGEVLKTLGLDPTTLYPLKPRPPPLTIEKLDRSRISREPDGTLTLVNPAPQTEEEEDLADALTPIHDELSVSKSWWLLEILPMNQRIQRKNNLWCHKFTSNMGKARYFPQGEDYPVRLHRTVKIRMETEVGDYSGRKYTPRASPLREAPLWAD